MKVDLDPPLPPLPPLPVVPPLNLMPVYYNNNVFLNALLLPVVLEQQPALAPTSMLVPQKLSLFGVFGQTHFQGKAQWLSPTPWS